MNSPAFDVVSIATPQLGDRSYVIADANSAVIIDPQRDIGRVLDVLDRRGWSPTYVLETHVHNDYVSGGLELSTRTGAIYVLTTGASVAFDHMPISDGEALTSGALQITAIATPGHTPDHLAYVVSAGGAPRALFTGGSLLFGAVGRTDLVTPDLTERLSRAQFRSVRMLAERLDDRVAVYPTHGFGSFCSSTPAGTQTDSTVGDERRSNPALRTDDEDRFVRDLVTGLSAYPRYYAHMAPINQQGPQPLDLSPARGVDAATLHRRIADGEWVVDLRDRRAYAASHLAGSYGFELEDSFATYVGWLIPWGTAVTLVADAPEQIARAQRDLARIGIDRPSGQATGGIEAFGDGAPHRSYRVADFSALAREQASRDLMILDVRRSEEWDASHITGARNVPIHDLPERLDAVPPGEVWVHCATGYRASIAAGIVDHLPDRTVVLIDDDFGRAAEAGLHLASDSAD